MLRRLEVKEQRRSSKKGFWPDDRPAGRTTVVHRHTGSLEYIVVHEMTHCFEHHQGERFAHFMDKHLPHRRTRREQLNGSPSTAEAW